MAKIDEVTVEVKAEITVDEKTAETCLRLLELYINSHPDMDIIGHYDGRGCVSYELKKKGGPDECDRLTPTR